jgi:hypothetical protein
MKAEGTVGAPTCLFFIDHLQLLLSLTGQLSKTPFSDLLAFVSLPYLEAKIKKKCKKEIAKMLLNRFILQFASFLRFKPL